MSTTTTPRLLLALIMAGNGGEALANRTFKELDAMVQLSIKDRDLSTPGSPTSGDCFIVKPTGTGAWTGKDNLIAQFIDGAWSFYTPPKGCTAFVEDESVVITWNGTAWKSTLGESIYAGRRTSSNVNAGTGSWTNLTWNADSRKDTGSFLHDTTTNPDQITLVEAGDYIVDADLTFEATGTAGLNRVDAKLTLGGSDVTGSFSSIALHTANFPRGTLHISQLVTATANQILSVAAERQSGSSTINFIADYCRVVIRRV